MIFIGKNDFYHRFLMLALNHFLIGAFPDETYFHDYYHQMLILTLVAFVADLNWFSLSTALGRGVQPYSAQCFGQNTQIYNAFHTVLLAARLRLDFLKIVKTMSLQ